MAVEYNYYVPTLVNSGVHTKYISHTCTERQDVVISNYGGTAIVQVRLVAATQPRSLMDGLLDIYCCVAERPALGGRPGYQQEVQAAKQTAVWDGPGVPRLASNIHWLKTNHCLTSQYLKWTKSPPTAPCRWCLYRTQTREHVLNKLPPLKGPAEDSASGGLEGGRTFKVRDLLANARRSQAVLDILSITDVGNMAQPGVRKTHRARRQSGNSRSGEKGKKRGDRRLGSWRSRRCYAPCPSSWHLRQRSREPGGVSFVSPLSVPLSFPLSFRWCALHLLGTDLDGGQRGITPGDCRLIEVEVRTVTRNQTVCLSP